MSWQTLLSLPPAPPPPPRFGLLLLLLPLLFEEERWQVLVKSVSPLGIGSLAELFVLFSLARLEPVLGVAAAVGIGAVGSVGGRMYSRWDVSSPFRFLRHTGHVPCNLSHSVMHVSWKQCLQGSRLASSFNLKSSIQMAHCTLFSTSSWVITTTGRLRSWSSEAGGGPVFSNWFSSCMEGEKKTEGVD